MPGRKGERAPACAAALAPRRAIADGYCPILPIAITVMIVAALIVIVAVVAITVIAAVVVIRVMALERDCASVR